MKKIIAVVLLLVMAVRAARALPETKVYNCMNANETEKAISKVYIADDNSTNKA